MITDSGTQIIVTKFISDKVKHEYMTSSRDQLKDILKVNFKQEDFLCHYYSGIATAQQKNR